MFTKGGTYILMRTYS